MRTKDEKFALTNLFSVIEICNKLVLREPDSGGRKEMSGSMIRDSFFFSGLIMLLSTGDGEGSSSSGPSSFLSGP